MMSAVEFYETTFHKQFAASVNHQYIGVTPFEFPNIKQVDSTFQLHRYPTGDSCATNLPAVATQIETREVAVRNFNDWVPLPFGIFSLTFANTEVQIAVNQLVQRAAGAYSLYCAQARDEYGRGCGVSAKLDFKIAVNNTPSDPNAYCQTPGWISYGMSFIACPQAWLFGVLIKESD